MPMIEFIKNSGFKVLSLIKLNDVQYSVVLYIMNTSVSGLDQIVINSHELAEMLDISQGEISDALYTLSDLNIIRIKYADKTSTAQDNPSMSLTLNLDTKKWRIKNSNRTHKDAIVYPFKRGNLISRCIQIFQ